MEKCQPKVSIVTVVFNDVKHIEGTILSVTRQNYPNLEYIVIDGGSTDGTVDVIKKYADKIAYWVSEPDKGVYDAMNKGIKMATGEWLNFMNVGDRFADENVLSKIFCRNYSENVQFIYSDNYYEDSSGHLTFATHEHMKTRILHQSAIYRRSLHTEHGYYCVTEKIIISDMLFFLQIPKENFYKTDVVISINQLGGMSSGANWCILGANCARVVFREYSFLEMLLHCCSAKLKMWMKNLKRRYGM